MKKTRLNKYLLPKTKLGRITLYLTAHFWAFIALFSIFVRAGYKGGDTFFSNPVLSIPVMLAGAAGVASFFTGVISFFKKEKSFIVFLCLLWGAFVILFISGEIITPH